IRHLINRLGTHAVCVPFVGGKYHPLAAVYRLEVLGNVNQLLAERRYRPIFLFDQVSTKVLREEDLRDADPGFESLRNLNTPAEYEEALRPAGLSDASAS